ncbi:MAG: MBL fold metallo-hydrolase [Actinomycetota bacterium]|jgi:flavorubredoxin|nr:MBL fold metallo-hydrolase [Rubrobacter sp.]MDQ3507297.1 MBL fold metallo-hydrolase [Actinomycetota bacterium]
MARMDEVAAGIYRISAFEPEFGITVNQFLIDDERPALIHTGLFQMYEDVRGAISEVLDPKRLSFVVCPHFEADECGGMGRFVEEAPEAVLACGEVGAAINISGWDYSDPVRGFRDGETLDLGEHKLRFMETPHVHHWDSMMVFEETTGSFFPADLFAQPGEQPAVVRENLGKEACMMAREVGIFAAEWPVIKTAQRIEELAPAWIHPMHSGSLPQESTHYYFDALRDEPFAFDGRIFGRTLPGFPAPPAEVEVGE